MRMRSRNLLLGCGLALGVLGSALGADAPGKLFERDNLVAWCIVPFDAKHRGPEERAAMLRRLGFRRFAYDWRAEHVASFDAELEALKKQGITLDAFWFPAGLDQDARTILDLLKRHQVRTQLWVTMGDPAPQATDQAAKVAAAVRTLGPIADAAGAIGCSVGLYNHGGWFGGPENQLAVIDALQRPNVGMVYNLHHGHDHLERFPALLKKMRPHLYAVNLNGMVKDGERLGKKIIPLGQGDLDLGLLKTIRDSGYQGPIGILGHTMDDAEARLKDNLDGLDWLVPQLDGKPPGPKPKPRTYSETPAASGGWIAPGRPEYRTPPLTVECRAKLGGKEGFNILVASDPKSSGAHWELFSWAGDGTLTVYLPGTRPDHVRSTANVCDGQWHDLAMQLEPDRVRLYSDGERVADQAVQSLGKPVVPGGLAFGRLVEGGLGCNGTLEFARLSRGVRAIAKGPPPQADDRTIGLWRFDKPGPARDLSDLKNDAATAALQAPASATFPEGNPLQPVDSRLKVVLIDRSDNDAYMAVKVDGTGRLFVGGREAVFVFEPDANGGCQPRRELLHFPKDSIIIGLEFRGDDLYVLASTALYRVPNGRVRRDGLHLERLVWGLPHNLHVSFHCLAWGPEGDLYLNHGDPLLDYGAWDRPDHWGCWTLFSQPEGTKTPYTGVGSVLRVRPDGSGLNVVAGGLRGPVGLAFDRDWDLFTNDNDHESRADQYAPARLLHVTPHADFGWPRGWMASMSPDRADLLEPMTAALGRGVPCDLTYYEEPYLADAVPPGLLMCRWDRMAVYRYPLTPRGASVATVEQPFLRGKDNVRPVGVAVGRGGRVFVTSLYLGGNVVSPYCPSDLVMITRADDAPAHPFPALDWTDAPAEALWKGLDSGSWEQRSRAHQELLRRGGGLLDEATRRLPTAEGPALPHLVWVARASGSEAAATALAAAAKHPRAEVRLQAVRALAELPRLKGADDVLKRALHDPAARVQLAALAGSFEKGHAPPMAAVGELAMGQDTYLRQTATQVIGLHEDPESLRDWTAVPLSRARLAGVLAAGRRLTVMPSDDAPPPELPLFFPQDSAFFHSQPVFADTNTAVDLGALGRVGSYTTAERWKAVAHSAEEAALFDLLVRALDDKSIPVRAQAAYYLSLLRDPRAEPLVERTRRAIRRDELAGLPVRDVSQIWAVGPFDDGDKGPATVHPPEQGAIDLSASYPASSGPLAWREVSGQAGRFVCGAPGMRSTVYGLFQLQSLHRQSALLTVKAEGMVKVFQNGQVLPDASESVLDLQPGSNDILVRAQSGGPVELRYRAGAGVVATVPERLDSSVLAQRLKSAGGPEAIGPEFLRLDWDQEVRSGDVGQGRKLFGTLGCVKCHAITSDQKGGGGPSLAEARNRFTVSHLVESILLPSKQVAAPFQGSVIATTDGRTLSGLVVNESADHLELLQADATLMIVPRPEVEERTVAKVSPMPAGLVRTPAELRAVLAYLLSEKPTPP